MPFDHDKWWQALPLFSLIVLLLVLHESPSSLAMLTEQENASATQDDDSPSEDADEKPSPELETLGNSLKAAVISGNMDEKQAWEIWSTAVEEIKGGQNDKRMWQDRQRDKEYDDTNARQRMARLLPPDPLEPAMLMEPEFLPRDVQMLSNWLELDEQRVLIVEMIVRDYGESMKELTLGMTSALQSYRTAEEAREMRQTLESLEEKVLSREIDMEASNAILQERVREYAREQAAKEARRDGDSQEEITEQVDAKTAEWTAELSKGLDDMEEQLRLLRDRMRSRVDSVKLLAGEVTSRDLVSMAERIRDQRRALRQDVLEMLRLVLVVEDELEPLERFASAMSRLRVEHGLRHARMGGEFINPWSLVRDLEQQPGNRLIAETMLSSQQSPLAEMVQARADAAVDREIEGLRLLVARDDLVAVAGDEDNVPIETWYEAIEPFTESWHRQIDASVAYRDSLLQLVEMTRQLIAEEDPRSANAYYDQSMKRGFGSELRTRWSERAMKAAIGIEDLEEETMLVVLALQEETLTRLRQIRDEAIQKRLLRDPELARQPILSLWSLDESREKPWTRSDWTGHGMESHQALNEHVQSSLRSLLTPEQFELIPGRGGRKDQAKTEWDKGDKGKTGGKAKNGGKGQKSGSGK